MKVGTSLVQKLHITGLKDLDPIQVYIENAGVGVGQITLVVAGEGYRCG